jgi:microsomal dipeptidase-like Zn-dependent dipeptidase
MVSVLRWIGIVLLLAALAGIGYVRFVVAPSVDAELNVVIPHPPYTISDEAKELHATLRVADLHADTLLWARDPMKRHDYGHTDLPRLREGGVALQVFSVVTKTPAGQNYESNTADTDNITILAMAQLWPIDTWGLFGQEAIFERARYQARRLQRIENKSNGRFVIARTKSDLLDALAARETDPGVLVGILETEGAHPLEGDLENIDRLYEEGYRMIGLQHFFDNRVGGSLHGVSGEGLTEFGRAAVQKIVEKGMIIDVAHSSHQVVRDVMAMTDRPLVVSHTGVFSACEAKRNIPDDLMAEITAGGGLIGIGYWEDVTCDDSPEGIARVIIHAANTFGVEHIALGSDYDGSVTTTFDTSQLAVISSALLDQGMSEEHIRLVMGENAIRFFSEHLPD